MQLSPCSEFWIVVTPAEGADTLRLDVWGAERKSDLLGKLLGAPLTVVEEERATAGKTSVEDGGPAAQ